MLKLISISENKSSTRFKSMPMLRTALVSRLGSGEGRSERIGSKPQLVAFGLSGIFLHLQSGDLLPFSVTNPLLLLNAAYNFPHLRMLTKILKCLRIFSDLESRVSDLVHI